MDYFAIYRDIDFMLVGLREELEAGRNNWDRLYNDRGLLNAVIGETHGMETHRGHLVPYRIHQLRFQLMFKEVLFRMRQRWEPST